MSSEGQKMVKLCSRRSGRERSFGKMGLINRVQGDALGFGGLVKQETFQRRVLRDCLGAETRTEAEEPRSGAAAQWPRSSEAPESGLPCKAPRADFPNPQYCFPVTGRVNPTYIRALHHPLCPLNSVILPEASHCPPPPQALRLGQPLPQMHPEVSPALLRVHVTPRPTGGFLLWPGHGGGVGAEEQERKGYLLRTALGSQQP